MTMVVTRLAAQGLRLDLFLITLTICWGMPQRKYVLRHLLSATLVLLLDKPFVGWGMPQIGDVTPNLLFLRLTFS